MRVTPLEKICGRSLTRWVGERETPLKRYMWELSNQCALVRVSPLKIYVGALSPDGLVRVTPLENFVGSLSPDGMVRVTPL